MGWGILVVGGVWWRWGMVGWGGAVRKGGWRERKWGFGLGGYHGEVAVFGGAGDVDKGESGKGTEWILRYFRGRQNGEGANGS